MSITKHLTPEHKTLVVALHANAVAGSKIFDKDAKTHAHVHPESGVISWRTTSYVRELEAKRGFVSVKCRQYHITPRYTVSVTLDGTRDEAHVDPLGGVFMQIEHKDSTDCTRKSVLWFGTKSASKAWQERGYAPIAPQEIMDHGTTTNERADAILASLAPKSAPVTEEPVTEEPVTEEPVTEEPVTEEPVTEEPTLTEPASLAPVSVGVEGEITLHPRAGESAAVFHARVEQVHNRLTGVLPPKEPTLHRDALAHLADLCEVAYDYVVDAYAEAQGRHLKHTPPAEWDEHEAEECLDCSALEDQDWYPPRTCDTWDDLYALIREAYERAAA